MLTPGKKNILHTTLANPKKILLLPLHIKLGFMKQFVNALPKDGNCFKYLCGKFLHLAKLKEGIFIGPNIYKIMFKSSFQTMMNTKGNEAWILFKDIVTKF